MPLYGQTTGKVFKLLSTSTSQWHRENLAAAPAAVSGGIGVTVKLPTETDCLRWTVSCQRYQHGSLEQYRDNLLKTQSGRRSHRKCPFLHGFNSFIKNV